MKEKLIYEDKYIIVFNSLSSFSVHSGTNTGYGLIDVIRKFRKIFEDWIYYIGLIKKQAVVSLLQNHVV